MKRAFVLGAVLCLFVSGYAQSDTGKDTSGKASAGDTIRIGNMIIVRSGGGADGKKDSIRVHAWHHRNTPSNISTDWIIFDIGFANYNDRTNYASAGAQQFAPGATSDWFRLRTGKSVDVNIWLFMQRINLIKHVVNFKYGFGIELNNYRYEDDVKFLTDPTKVILDTIHYSKDKLALDYFTVPLMLNFDFNPHGSQHYGLSAGVSVGYKYSSRQKFKSPETGKKKTYNDFDTEAWKISWVGELQLGEISFYGSYALRSMFHKGLDMTPYTIGIRLGNR